MFKHFLVQFLRNIKRDKISFGINLIGLSTGLACVLIIFLWVKDELNMDKFHKKENQLYQVMIKLDYQDLNDVNIQESTQGLLARSMKKELPEVEYAVSVYEFKWLDIPGSVSYKNQQIKAKEQYVSNDFFKIFSYELTQGDKNKWWQDKYAVLLSDEVALKLFNTTENLIGKAIEWKRVGLNSELIRTYTVAGIFKKTPSYSSEQFDILFSYNLIFDQMRRNLEKWNNHGPYTYITVKEGTNLETFRSKITDFTNMKNEDLNETLILRSYSDKYLYNKYENGKLKGGRIVYVKLFSIVAIFILVIACVNFMTLSTAMSAGKRKGIGIKKVVGSGRRTLIFQLIGESLFIVFLSLGIAIILVILFLPTFNTFTDKQLSFNLGIENALFVVIIIFITGIFAGSYPAFYLSGLNPVKVFKGNSGSSVNDLFIRKGLVIFQYIISIILIFSFITIHKQLSYIFAKDLGYNKDNVICFNNEEHLIENRNAFLSELSKIPGIINISNSAGNLSGKHSSTTTQISIEGVKKESSTFKMIYVNYDFFETLDIMIKEGRVFSKEFGSEQSKIVLNETAIKKLNIDDPIGKTAAFWGRDKKIIGLVKDFNYETLHKKIEPCIFLFLDPNSKSGNNIWIKIDSNQQMEIISRIEKVYKSFNPGLPFEYKFLDEEYEILYKSEKQVSLLSRYFAAIAILISCMGIFGLAAFNIQNRTKEIGVRKVNGAKTVNVLALLNIKFLKWVIFAIIIALPLSYLSMNKWLENFAYKTELSWWIYLLSGLSVIIITLLTVSWQSFIAARRNPVEALRYE